MLHDHERSFRSLLTNREREILEYIAIGLSAKEIALELPIAPRTVERHIENIRLKMGARNRAHMVMLAIMSGLLKMSGAGEEQHVCPACMFGVHHMANDQFALPLAR